VTPQHLESTTVPLFLRTAAAVSGELGSDRRPDAARDGL
jgi:hypothetical protein